MAVWTQFNLPDYQQPPRSWRHGVKSSLQWLYSPTYKSEPRSKHAYAPKPNEYYSTSAREMVTGRATQIKTTMYYAAWNEDNDTLYYWIKEGHSAYDAKSQYNLYPEPIREEIVRQAKNVKSTRTNRQALAVKILACGSWGGRAMTPVRVATQPQQMNGPNATYLLRNLGSGTSRRSSRSNAS